jgi:hypothetical protein
LAGVDFTSCGALLRPDLAETVTPSQGMPSNPRMINHLNATAPPTPAAVPAAENISSEPTPW